MQHIPDMRIGDTHVHGNKLGKEMNRIKDESLYASVNKLFRQLLQRYPGPLRVHHLEGVADDILSLERCQMRITSCPRACIVRLLAVIGRKYTVSGMLRKPIFIICNSRKTVVTSGVRLSLPPNST